VWLYVYGSLIPEGEAVIVDLLERIVGKEFGRIRRRYPADMVAIA